MQKLKERPNGKKSSRRLLAEKHFTTSGAQKMVGDYLLTEETRIRKGVEPAPFRKLDKELEQAHHKEHGIYMVVIKPGKNPQFFKRSGIPINAQRVRLMKDPDDPSALIANLELYEFI